MKNKNEENERKIRKFYCRLLHTTHVERRRIIIDDPMHFHFQLNGNSQFGVIDLVFVVVTLSLFHF